MIGRRKNVEPSAFIGVINLVINLPSEQFFENISALNFKGVEGGERKQFFRAYLLKSLFEHHLQSPIIGSVYPKCNRL